jgi:leucyl aminopeptidase (aminopeptidase T)
MKNALKVIIDKCMGVKKKDACLIITDATDGRLEIANELYKIAARSGKSAELLIIPESANDGAEPKAKTAKKMLLYDVIFILTKRSLSHTKSRADATKKGIRIASMPGITKDIIKRAIDVDYKEMRQLTKKIADRLDSAKKARVITKKGTDITFSLKGRIAHGKNSGIYHKKGDWGNLPEGEAYIAPVEGSANGIYVVDASQAGVGKLKAPIKITVRSGFAVSFSGSIEAKKLKKLLFKEKNKNAFNLAEFGIGTNKKAKITGKILEDEKVFGTCHFALGNNIGFGGKTNVPIHLDGILQRPTIIIDGKEIMKNGKLII